MAMMFIPVSTEILRVSKSSNPTEIYLLLVLVITLLLTIGFITRMEKYREKIMTGFFIFHYCLGFFRVFKSESGYFSNPINAYYTGTNLAIYEGIVCSRIPRFSHQVAFSLANLALRFYLIFPDDHQLLLFHIFFIFGKLFLEKNKKLIMRICFGAISILKNNWSNSRTL